jgi:hypothetical protein
MSAAKRSRRMASTALVAMLAASCAGSVVIAPFTSDGCSLFPEGTPRHKELWLSCCVEHDKAYWRGGTYEDRVVADKALRRCVESVGEPEIAALMLAGVRVGGSPYWPTEFRWGYGWPWPHNYGVLTDDEREQARRALLAYERR